MCGSHGQATCNHVEGGQSCNMQSSRVQDIYHSGPHTNYDNQMKSDTDIMLEDDRDNIRARESKYVESNGI